jgi:hypothetical protein
LPPIAQIDRSGRGSEHQSTRLEILGRQVGKQRRVERPLRHCHISGVGNELRELPIGHRVLLDREGLDMSIMDRPFVWVELLRAHLEGATGQLDQVRQRAHANDASRCASRWLAWAKPKITPACEVLYRAQ